MDFHGMNRRNLQILCKKHGIPANLKNIEMANRLASLFQKEDEETVTETKVSPEEDSVEADDGIKEEEEDLVVSRKGKKVRFSPESDNQVFEFTRSVKKNVRTIRRKHGKALEEDGRSVELKRSKRSVSKGITVDGSNSVSGIVEVEKGDSNSVKVTRRSKRIGSKGSAQEEGKETDLIAQEQFGDKDIQNGRRSTRLAARTEKSCVEGGASKAVALLHVAKRSKRIGSGGSSQEEGKDSDLIAQEQFGARDVKDGRRSTKMAGKIEKSYEEGGTSKSVALLPTAKRSKRIGSGGSTQEEGKDTDLNAPELFEDRDVQGGRRSTRLAAKTEQSFEEGGTSKSVTLLPAAKRSKQLVDVANKEDGKETGEEQHRKDDDSKVEVVRRRSMRFVNDIEAQGNTQDRRRSVRLKASVANPLMGQAKNDSVKASRVVKGTLVESSKRVTRNMKRDRSAETGVDGGTASNQSNITSKKTMDEFAHFEQEEACGADVKAGGSSKKSKSMNQECIKDKPQGIVIIEDSPASSKTKAAESVEEECEEKLERDAVMPVIEEDKEPTCHILVKDVASTVIVEESTKTKDEALIYAPESELKEHSSIAKLSNVEEILENSTECCKEIHSSEAEDDEKCSSEKDVRAENLHGNVSECNTENSSAKEEIKISKVGGMSADDCVNLTPEKLSGEYAQLESEEAERPNVEARSCSQKMKKIVGQELVKDKPRGMAEDSPSTSETKAGEPVMISENVLDSKRKVSDDTSAVRNSHELNSEFLEEKREEKHEQATILLVATKKDKGEASSLSEFLIERSEVKTSPRNCSTGCSLSVETTLSPTSLQLAMFNPEAYLGVPTDNDIGSAVLTEEDKITKDTIIFTPTSELKENNSVDKISKVEVTAIMVNSAESCKEEKKGSLKKDGQAENLHVNFSECNTENSISEDVEISKDSFMSVNLTPEELLDTYTQLVLEEAGGPNMEIRSSSKKMKTASSEFLKENPQGMVEDSPSTSMTKTSETIMMSGNVSVDISPVGNTQELNPELADEEREEKQELHISLVAETDKEKKNASSEVIIPESELFVGTSPPPPSSVHIAVSNPESELSVPTGHILVKDIVSAVIAAEDIKAEEVPKSVHSFVAKLSETDVLENSAACWNESLSSKDDDRGSLEKEKQSAERHGNFSEYNTENSSAEEQADICKVGRISDGHCVDRENLDEVKDESLIKSVQTVSSERVCNPNASELSGLLSTEFASHTHKEANVSECLEEEEMKALSQPTPINKAASKVLDRSSLFTTPERNLMLMEQLSESGKICAADIVTQHSDEAVESVVFTTPEKVLLLGDSGLDEAGNEEEHTTTDFPDDLNTTQNEAFDEKERIVVELHDESNIAASPLRQSSVEESTERNEEIRTSELHCESGTCTGPDKHAALLNSVSDGAETVGGNKAMEFYEESVGFTGLEERRELFGYSGHDKAREGEVTKAAQFYEEVGLSSEMHKDLPLADPELGERGLLEINNADKSGSLEGQLLYGDSEQKTAVKSAEKEAAQFHDESAVLNILERHLFLEESELEEATKSEESNALELQADCDNFTGANVSATSHDMYDVLTTESHTLMGDFEPDEEENKDVELLGESNISTNEESGQDEMIKQSTAANCEESFVFISPERRHHLGNSERKEVEFKDETPIFTRLEARLLLGESGQDRLGNGESGSTQFQSHHASSPKVILKDNSVIREIHVAAPDFRENTITASKVSHSHEFSAGKETSGAGFKASQAENVVGLDVMQGTSKQSRENSPHVDSVNHFDFDTMRVDTTMDAERNVSFSSYVLALPAKGNSQTTGDISNSLEVARTCSLVSDSEESGPSADIQNQIHDATDELIDAKVPKNTQNDSEAIGLPAEGDSETIGKISSQLEFTETCYSSMVSLEVTETCYSSMVSGEKLLKKILI
ncbi:unnamed protein product [Eruca vesicaria subsp. sativa]|uniref:Uncharacterized protein n=1 Tax=Eruca vesicaria subsp. sativa TaxID=29727 RepID=A0ABC8L906_ERUVS|nr:unnamed protein product [Eruca vesicaria subsp. sativa]